MATNKITMNDNTLFIKNINFLKEYYGKKIGEIEKEISVSQGYFSRVAKNSTRIPEPAVLEKLSDIFYFTPYMLMHHDLSVVEFGDPKRILQLLDKIIENTLSDKYSWTKDTHYDIDVNDIEETNDITEEAIVSETDNTIRFIIGSYKCQIRQGLVLCLNQTTYFTSLEENTDNHPTGYLLSFVVTENAATENNISICDSEDSKELYNKLAHINNSVVYQLKSKLNTKLFSLIDEIIND